MLKIWLIISVIASCLAAMLLDRFCMYIVDTKSTSDLVQETRPDSREAQEFKVEEYLYLVTFLASFRLSNVQCMLRLCQLLVYHSYKVDR